MGIEHLANGNPNGSKPSPVRVLQINSALYFGGAEKVVVTLALGIDRSRFNMAVCCTKALGPLSEPLLENGITVRRAGPAGRIHNFLRPWHVRNVIADFKPDVIHTHGISSLVDVGQLALLRQVPRWIHTYHFGNYPYKDRRYMAAERLFSRVADQLIAVSDVQRQALIDLHRLDPARIMTIHNGVSVKRFASDERIRAAKKSELGIPSSAPVIGSVAVLTEQKGCTYLLQAAQQIHHRFPGVRFLIVGGGPLEQALRAEAIERGLENVVVFTGWRGDVAELLRVFDVFVMSSLWEAMPVALLEAMAARLPIIVTDVGQNAVIVEDGISGAVVRPRDVAAIAEAAMGLLANPTRAAALAAAACQRVEREFGTAKMVDCYQKLYETSRA
jgi:glycosyltransferase involved in cell wall biosynthesis